MEMNLPMRVTLQIRAPGNRFASAIGSSMKSVLPRRTSRMVRPGKEARNPRTTVSTSGSSGMMEFRGRQSPDWRERNAIRENGVPGSIQNSTIIECRLHFAVDKNFVPRSSRNWQKKESVENQSATLALERGFTDHESPVTNHGMQHYGSG